MSEAEPPRPRGLKAFFAPRGVAVVGASRSPSKVGHAVVRNLLYGGCRTGGGPEERARGFPGLIVPINPKADEILGLPVCPSVDDLSGPIDLAVFAVPAEQVPSTMDVVARKGVQAAIVLSAGFFEMGAEGRRLEEQLRSVSKNAGIRVIGPNCMGIFAAESRLQASFFSGAPYLGPISLITQSGAIGQALVQYSHAEAIGLRHVVSIGDKVDVEDAELVRYFARDDETRVIALYLESLDDPRAFYDAVRESAPKKPVVVLRGGHTGAGHRAAKVHEGILGVSDSSLDGALLHPGVFRADSLVGFLAAVRALAYQPPAAGRRVAIVTNGGGAGVLATDRVTAVGLEVVKLKPDTAQRLREITGNPRAAGNPVDLLGDAKADTFLAALETVSRADEVDMILLVLTDQAMTDALEVAHKVCDFAPALGKPLLASFIGLVGQPGERHMETHGVPVYDFPELAVQGLRALAARGSFESRVRRGRYRPRQAPKKAKGRW